jgi:hypothetical protein
MLFASDDDIDVPMCLAHADEVASVRRGLNVFRGDTSASRRPALLMSNYATKTAESC